MYIVRKCKTLLYELSNQKQVEKRAFLASATLRVQINFIDNIFFMYNVYCLFYFFIFIFLHVKSQNPKELLHHYTPTSRVVGILEYPCSSVRPSLNHVYVTSHLFVFCWILFIFGVLAGHDLSMHILYRFHGWLIFARVLALFMFV